MTRKAFIDSTGLLMAHGHMDQNNSDESVEVPEDFNLEPRRHRFVDGAWVPVTFDIQAALPRMRAHRAPILDALAGLITDTDEPGDVTALRTARQGLKDLPQWLEALPPELKPTDDESFDDACVYRYKQLAAALPVHLQSAFKGAA